MLGSSPRKIPASRLRRASPPRASSAAAGSKTSAGCSAGLDAGMGVSSCPLRVNGSRSATTEASFPACTGLSSQRLIPMRRNACSSPGSSVAVSTRIGVSGATPSSPERICPAMSSPVMSGRRMSSSTASGCSLRMR